MYVVTYFEHIPILEGIDEGSEDGARTGKSGPELVALFDNEEAATKFCQNIEKNWCSGSRKLPSVLTFWYEIHNHTVGQKHDDPYDWHFISSFNKFGCRMPCDSATVQDAMESEKKYKAKKAKKNKKGKRA